MGEISCTANLDEVTNNCGLVSCESRSIFEDACNRNYCDVCNLCSEFQCFSERELYSDAQPYRSRHLQNHNYSTEIILTKETLDEIKHSQNFTKHFVLPEDFSEN